MASGGDWLNDVDGDNIPGRAGIDYPVHSSVPKGTSFRCGRFEYAGYFADAEADCQVCVIIAMNNLENVHPCKTQLRCL